MPSQVGFDLQKGIYTALTTNAQLMAAITGVYDYVPEQTSYPYVVIGETTGTLIDEVDRKGAEHTETIHIFSKYKGKKECWDLMSRIQTILESGFSLTTDSIVFASCTFSTVLPEDDVYHGVMRFRFAVHSISAIPTDPWLDVLATWTGTKLTGWTVYKNMWPANYVQPAVLWQLSNMQIKEHSRGAYEVQKRFTAQVLGSVPNEHIGAITTIVDGLASEIKLTLDAINKKYLTVVNPVGSTKPDSFMVGQVVVTLKRITTRPQAEVPVMQHVYSRGTLS